jgi:Gpi18-like mannosyltransferase
MNDALHARAGVRERPVSGYLVAFVALLIAGAAVRALFLPHPGLAGDLDQFVVWMRGISANGLGRAYDQTIAFPPVMVFLWAGVGTVASALAHGTGAAADAFVAVLMKLPSVAADLLLATAVAWHLRATPRWSLLAAALILLHPAVIDVSSLWGQYESLYLLPAAIAFVLLVRGHSTWAAVAIAVALMTKPQALPLAVPFAAWYVAREGSARTARAAVVAAAVIVSLWLPFVAAGGIGRFFQNVAEYQGGIYAILSLRAWNAWWLIQELLGGGSFIGDQAAVIGPVTLRTLGFALAVLGEIAVFALVLRAPTPRALAYGLAAAALVAFCLLTSMHERYAYAAAVFLPLAFPDRRALTLAVAFGVVFTLNLLAAVPPPELGGALAVGGALGVVGSIAMLVIVGSVFAVLANETAAPARVPEAQRLDFAG